MRKRHSPEFKAQVTQELLGEEKTASQLAAEYGVHPNQLYRWREIALAGLPSLFSGRTAEEQAMKDAAHAQEVQEVHELYAQIGEMSAQLAWLKNNLAEQLSRETRMALVERGPAAQWPLTTQAQLLSLNRSSWYYRPVVPPADELALKRRVDERYDERSTAHPFCGVRRITAQLRREGLLVNHIAVARHMRELGLAGITPGPNLSKRQQNHAIYPYLLRGVTASAANQVWGIDITSIRLTHGWLYLVAVLDWYSRYVVSWELDQTLHMGFVPTAARRVLAQARPCIWNSDQGSHFTSPQYLDLLVAAGVRVSMDGRGRAHDTIFQYFRRALVAHGAGRGGVPARVCQPTRGP